ncbi:MAG: patatin-like phospholipase family protein [Solobacterium sp.]|nr:patatin-like phospholipase family protein [Solobacterium sp.]
MKKKALVLAGGGTKGIYQLGVIDAMRQYHQDDWNIITGTSVGALNAMMLVQKDYDAMEDMYENLKAEQIIKGYIPTEISLSSLIKDRDSFIPSFRHWLKEKGVDVSPFIEMVRKYYHPDRFFASEIDFGCMVATQNGHEPVYVTKDMMREHGEDWLVATASAYPAFPVRQIEEKGYVDGGYFDNLPVDFALRLGAEEILAIDLNSTPQHPLYLNKESIMYLHPHEELYEFLDFDKEKMARARLLGYHDGLKALHVYDGIRYTFYLFADVPWLNTFMCRMLLLETRIHLANPIPDRFFSAQMLYDRLKKQTRIPALNYHQVFLAMMDKMMEICDFPSEKVYDIDQVMEEISKQLAPALDPDFAILPASVIDAAGYLKTLDTKSMVLRFTHVELYQKQEQIPQSLVLTVYPMEAALALFAVCILKEGKRYGKSRPLYEGQPGPVPAES